jgi:hypothetical protein
MTTLSGCIRCVVRLAVTPSWSSTHRSTNVPGHGGDVAAYGGFGVRGRRRLQVLETQRVQSDNEDVIGASWSHFSLALAHVHHSKSSHP